MGAVESSEKNARCLYARRRGLCGAPARVCDGPGTHAEHRACVIRTPHASFEYEGLDEWRCGRILLPYVHTSLPPHPNPANGFGMIGAARPDFRFLHP
jgi:hypothetical protein